MQSGAQFWPEEDSNCLVNSSRVRPFKHLKQIVRGDQGADLAQSSGGIRRLTEDLLIALLELSVVEVHDAIQMTAVSVKLTGATARTPSAPPGYGGLRFAHGQDAGRDRLAIERLDGGLRAFRRNHGHEPESARLAAGVVHRDVDICNVAVGGKQKHHLLLRNVRSQILHV